MSEVIVPTIRGLRKEGMNYCGFLYAGLMIDKNENIKVLEFNCRFGDPETQPILLRMKSDLVNLCSEAAEGKLTESEILWDERVSLGVVMAAGGYPNHYDKGLEISGLYENETEDLKVFHAGTSLNQDAKLVTNGGRVLCVTALGLNTKEAKEKAYKQVESIKWEKAYFRKDIGYRALNREEYE